MAFKSFTEQFLDGTGAFRDAVLAILACIAKQERVRISERVLAGLDRAKAKGKRLGRPAVDRSKDKHADRIREMREDGENYQQIADQLGRSASDIQRVCMTLGCTAATQSESMTL